MGVAGHGMGDEVWDWLFEPNGPGFGESYLPSDFLPFVGPGGLELQMDLVAIMRHDRPTAPTVDLPDAGKILGAFQAVGRSDILATRFRSASRGSRSSARRNASGRRNTWTRSSAPCRGRRTT